VRVAVQKIEGVDAVEVSLNRGIVEIRLKPENGVSLEQVREAIRVNGFTPKEALIRARGTVVEDSGALALALSGREAAFRLAAHPESPGIIEEVWQVRGQEVILEGRVPETARRAEGLPRLEALKLVRVPQAE